MKTACAVLILSIAVLTGCSTTYSPGGTKADRETVLVTYHVKAGNEAELEATLLRAWQIYRTEHLVVAKPHIIVHGADTGGGTRFVEMFTWASHAAPEHAPDSIKKIWEQEQSLCEARNGHEAIQGGEVELITAK
jgi:hypothetical protein